MMSHVALIWRHFLQTDPSNKNLEFNRDFLISHYAGDVKYSVFGFIEKNKDTLFQDFKRLLYNSKNEMVKSMWPDGAKRVTSITKRPVTAGTNFKNSIIALVEKLASKVSICKEIELATFHALAFVTLSFGEIIFQIIICHDVSAFMKLMFCLNSIPYRFSSQNFFS